ncbi:MAG: iron complex outermembrane receptor protein [Polaribacter sp.]|jgi:iron complex outermembrane receptor protein
MRILLTLSLLFTSLLSYSQTSTIKGQLQDAESQAISYANVILYAKADSAMLKVEPTDEGGVFQIRNIAAGDYFLKASYVGYPDISKEGIRLKEGENLDMGVIAFGAAAIELAGATVTATRALVEVKPDRTVFNVQGTINSVGENAIALLRKAPGVTVDNNDNVSVLGRSGVLIFVDGKRLPLGGTELSAYLSSLTAEQIDRIDIITSPGAKYEAEGNAGIIDIRLKKDKSLGTNGTVSGTFSQGEYATYNGSFMANYRNKKMNVFGTIGGADGTTYSRLAFETYQNGIYLSETNRIVNENPNLNYRLGTDFFVTDKSTIGFLASGNKSEGSNRNENIIIITPIDAQDVIDSVLVANSSGVTDNTNQTYNINYRYDSRKGRSLNIDLDYGNFRTTTDRMQPNAYYTDPSESVFLSKTQQDYETKSDIDIYTVKLDFEEELLGGKLGLGGKFSNVISDNDFLVFDVEGADRIQNQNISNSFTYDESVYAAYLSFARPLNRKWNMSFGLRTEQTNADGDLITFNNMQNDTTIELNYLQWFPSAGLTFQAAPMHAFSFNYGRRINRPDYNVLNPFEVRLSELSYEKGNPGLSPEIVNNFELGYTYAYRYNLKLAYSKTDDQITRLLAADDIDPRAGFITWANLATQTIYSLNLSLPMEFTKIWSGYFNLSGSYQDNQAEYENGDVVDVQAWSYNIYQQQTFKLPKGFTGEISGYFSGPGIWGGVFEYDVSWALGVGLQKKFLNDKLNVKVSMNDIFYESGWAGQSEFGGSKSFGNGNWDSRKFTVSASYSLGNQNVKSRKRKVGMEKEAGRVGG